MALETVDTAIGIVFFYCLFSILCTAVSEVIEALAKRRAGYLWKGLCRLLNDDEQGTRVVRALYEHPIVFGLTPAPAPAGKAPATSKLPSYIPAGNFALALLGVLLKDQKSLQVLTTTSTVPGAVVPETAQESIRTTLAKHEYTGKALIQLADSAGWDPVQFRKNIEAWYDAGMDRIAGWYKRYAQAIIFCIALPAAVLLNADSIKITHALAVNPALRAAVVEQAKACLADANCRQPPTTQCTTPSARPTENIDSAMKAVAALGLPLGWEDNPPPPLSDHVGWLLKVLGLLITAFAAVLGAPFWFDVLNKLMIVRSTVKPKEKSPDEPPVGGTKPPSTNTANGI